MLVALIAALVAALIAIVVIAVAFVVRSRTSAPSVGKTKGVRQLDTVGVGSSPFERRTSAKAAREGDVTVSSSDNVAAQKPSDGLTGRFAAMGAAAAAIFGVLAAKLWSMQILGNSEYADAAEQNLYTTVNTPAPRGCIYDMFGTPLVVNEASQTVLADPDVADNRDVVRRLATVLGLPANVVMQRIKDSSAGAQSLRVVASDVRLRDVAFIAEHADAFPGITVEERASRTYPYGALAAHVLGYTGSPSEDDLKANRDGRQILSIDTVGKAGVEASYDQLLAGEHGESKVMVDAAGRRISVMSDVQDSKGSDLYLTIDAKAQYVADAALAKLIAPSGVIGRGTGTSGAVVALDVRDGAVLVMASYPTFDPTNFTGSISEEIMDIYNDRKENKAYQPLNNRAISGQYPAASTFKAFTSLAGLEYGTATETSTWNCTGEWDGFGSGDVQKCWNHDGHGTLDLHGGIVNSCDTVFYEIAKGFYDRGPAGTGELSETALQEYLEEFGFGERTGVDLAGESVGLIPTPEWKAETFRNRPSEASWRGGDYTNMIIGQGDVLVTPLQIAAAYGGVATGQIMKPHVLREVRNGEGETVVTYQPEVVRVPEVNEGHLNYVRESLHDMVRESKSVGPLFEELGIDAAGKSGTGEKAGQDGDTAWFVAYAPYNDPKYVVACVVEQGGGGSATAAPVVAEVMSALIASQEGVSDVEVGRIAGSTGQSVELTVDSSSRTD
ncbi:penicillin-binding protein 2 [Adlercreutzia sp. R21]|uniref:Penicillin-binding protein 2 n=1 Tax=Adlercreutzia wanghongyangiae TaxID=3111451 RepID=A0ABU6IGE2_9ACTN|nr:penicillin-binding protein 2 [Adlercreutzia sp. R21]MEC4175461.1 penicillin-binding protein 2 [Adlercreutzia sp. R7]MEC4183314.1 penicillin-binding protein 2 [Adlercreutzia sp. R21]